MTEKWIGFHITVSTGLSLIGEVSKYSSAYELFVDFPTLFKLSEDSFMNNFYENPLEDRISGISYLASATLIFDISPWKAK